MPPGGGFTITNSQMNFQDSVAADVSRRASPKKSAETPVCGSGFESGSQLPIKTPGKWDAEAAVNHPSPKTRPKENNSRMKPFFISTHRLGFLAVFAAVFSGCVLKAQVPPTPLDEWRRMEQMPPRSYGCGRAELAPVIDGRLDDPAWQIVPWTQDFVDIEGSDRPQPRYRTRAKMLWDAEYFYVAAELEEPHVWGTLTNHDAVIFQDNDFEVFIDPDGDRHEYYEFEINALNTGWDLRLKKPYKDGGPALNEWEIPGLKTAVHVKGTLNDPANTDAGWTVEIAFPWKVLAEFAHRKTPPAEGDQWRVNFSRVEWHTDFADGKYHKLPGLKEDNWVWSPQGIIDLHRPEQWGYVQFTHRPTGAIHFVPDPAGKAKQRLQEIYYAQRAYRGKNGHWAKSLGELDLSVNPKAINPAEMKLTPDGFEVTVEVRLSRKKTQRWHIREDARVWPD